MDVIEKVKELTKERGWSEYRLAKESGLSGSTIANIFHRNTIPSIPTLEILCEAFGITLSQFFYEGEAVYLSHEQKQVLRLWSYLTGEQQLLASKFLETMK